MNKFACSQLFDGDHIVVHIAFGVPGEALPAEGFELVDKETNRIVFLTGDQAAAFQDRIDYWQECTPGKDEVELTIDAFMSLGTMPLVMH